MSTFRSICNNAVVTVQHNIFVKPLTYN